jgi:hypothetical protein
MTSAIINFNKTNRIEQKDANFFNLIQPYQHHSSIPKQGIYTYSFAIHPEKWIPLYSMVTYSPHIRYSEALVNGNKQQAIMDKIMAMPDIEAKWDSAEVENAILKSL